MQEQLIDFGFLREISGNDPEYMFEVIRIFLDSTPEGVKRLGEMIATGDSWDAVSKQAHSLKSSVSVIKIRGVYDHLAEIENITRQKQEINEDTKDKITQLFNTIVTTFAEAEPVLVEEMKKNKPVGE